MDGITGKIALVTGAAQGNGRAIAEGFVAQGARVVISDVQAEALERAADELRALGGEVLAFAGDVADRAQCFAMAEKVQAGFGAPLDILINNAGVIRRTPTEGDTFEADWEFMMRINATGTMNMIQAFLPQLRQTKGRIVNLASIMSVLGGPGLVAYAASKGAVLQMTRALVHDLSNDGIRINALAPGVIETPMTQATRDNPDAIGRFMAHTPMRRPGKPEELVGPVLFLASDASSYVTGALLPVDGGYLVA